MTFGNWLRQATSIVGVAVGAATLVGVWTGALSDSVAATAFTFAGVLVAIPEHPHVPVALTRRGPAVPTEPTSGR